MSAGSRSAFFSSPRPRVFAHRGLALEAPENTLLAFANALSTGVGYLETDVHVSQDGVAVLSHDPDLQRLAGRAVRVNQMTMSELRRITLGAGQSFCSLADALSAFPHARFNLDIKVAGAAVPAARAILDARATDRVLIGSFSESNRVSAVELLPGVATSASTAILQRVLAASSLGTARQLRRILSDVQAVQVPEQVKFLRIVTPRFVRVMHAAGVEVHVWTVNDPHAMTRLLNLGVDGIMTDRCDIARAVIAAHS
ncbi:glycerophosphodiester phosphodiesterase [Glaciibacter psychrotolerans]|uniref:Glycerophosphoryl diester phosphodiesterase n=1 Tax=Glaciibacter psychrotolerans TaxID=670054 RepID=A0A7Z0J5M3_9MICO|nr:glycerophosphodiester phosphodiesterase [Leifsonia psychrotolerans]NYJ19296.1 glycerophosphoryl diester phosphodiesterase [Leifsonia psychrotolerans]